jgi:hypothetical protein
MEYSYGTKYTILGYLININEYIEKEYTEIGYF